MKFKNLVYSFLVFPFVACTSCPLVDRIPSANVIEFQAGLWPNGIIYYDDSSLSASEKAIVAQAMIEWSSKTPIRFIRSRSSNGFILFRLLPAKGIIGGESYIGYRGVAQPLTFYGTVEPYVALHEIGHAIGFYHEHQRADRDKFVHIHPSSIPDNLKEGVLPKVDVAVGPYDYASVMHYKIHGLYTKTSESISRGSNLGPGDILGAYYLYGTKNEYFQKKAELQVQLDEIYKKGALLIGVISHDD